MSRLWQTRRSHGAPFKHHSAALSERLLYVDVEVRTPRGRGDIVMRTATTLYIIELKLNQSAATAMKQISLRDYPSRFALCGLPVVNVGISFDSETKTISDWNIKTQEQ